MKNTLFFIIFFTSLFSFCQSTETTTKNQNLNDDNKVISFAVIEEVPIYPGCQGTKSEKRKCFNKSIGNFFATNFNVVEVLKNNPMISVGKKTILISFTIDKNGFVNDFLAKAPHESLKEEALRVLNTLPRMEPGTQRGKPVSVKFALPFSIIVQ